MQRWREADCDHENVDRQIVRWSWRADDGHVVLTFQMMRTGRTEQAHMYVYTVIPSVWYRTHPLKPCDVWETILPMKTGAHDDNFWVVFFFRDFFFLSYVSGFTDRKQRPYCTRMLWDRHLEWVCCFRTGVLNHDITVTRALTLPPSDSFTQESCEMKADPQLHHRPPEMLLHSFFF